MVTEKLDTYVYDMYINESEEQKNEENVQTAKFCARLILTAICNACRAVVASQPLDSMLTQYVELHTWVIKKVRGLNYLKPNQ